MGRRKSRGTTHFIHTIKRGQVIISRNTNCQGRPVTKFRRLKDVYENEGANGLQRLPPGQLFAREQGKHEDPCFSKPKSSDEFSPSDHNLDSNLNDDTTLNQLKKRLCRKAALEESDLYEPLINLKPKRSKTSKSKRRRINISDVSSSTVDVAIKYDEILVSEGSPQVICVDSKDPDEGLNPGVASTNGFQNMVLCGCRDQVNFTQANQNCSNDDDTIFYDHVEEDAEPISELVPWDGIIVDLECVETECEEFVDSPPLYTHRENETMDAHCCSLSTMEEISSSSIQVSDKEFDGESGLPEKFNSLFLEYKTETDIFNELQDSPSSPDKKYISYSDSNNFLKNEENVVSTEDTIADEKQPLSGSFNVTRMDGLNCEGQSEGELLKAEEKKTKALSTTDGESQSSLKIQTSDIADTLSTPKPCLSPENLVSTRKEQLCFPMNSVDTRSDADQNECKEKLFEKQTTNKASFMRSEIQHDEVTVSHKRPDKVRHDKVRQQKITMSPRKNIKKSQVSKGNLEGSRLSRSFPILSTECTSIQSCSERAIEFSKQQMHDMESLALNLMNELKSMKDIVEQKLLFESYRNVSLKNDADEIKSAIKRASKVGETSRKQLCVLSRDCNRFCKIMKMTPNTATAPKDTTPKRERRKIVFADEAGGRLCHVKFFEGDIMTSSPIPDGMKNNETT